MKKTKTKAKAKRRNNWKIPAVFFGLLVLTYLGISVYFINHFCWRTTLNGNSVSAFSAEKVRSVWEKEVSDYALKIKERNDQVEVIQGSDINLSLKWDYTVDKLVAGQNPLLWPLKLVKPDAIETDAIVEYDQGALDEFVGLLNCMSEEMQIMPVDATFSEFSDKDGITLVEYVDGTAIDSEVFLNNLHEAIESLDESYDIAKQGGYIQPNIKNDDETLLANIETMNEYAKASITYEVGDDVTVLDANTFGSWFRINKKNEVTIKKSKIEEYVNELSRKYNTCYSAKKLKTSYGKTIKIPESHYGWKINGDKEAKKIKKTILAGKTVTREPYYSMTANSHGKNDYGDSYVEINLTAQHLYVFKDGKMVFESDFVSGNTSKNNGTPTGAYGITYTQKDAVLRGDDYETPVGYWMPFAGNVGMHDANWRSRFGGAIYKTGGSHGCVNLPPASAARIFEIVSKNYPVLVYELPGTENNKKLSD